MKQQNFFQNIDLIKSNESDPQVINLFSLEEIKDILKFYNDLPLSTFNEKQKIKKKHWILGLNRKMDDFIISKINKVISNWKVDNMYSKEEAFGIFHESFNPIKLHVDTGKDKNKIIYKQILIPLTDTGDTILFEPRWYGPSSTFTIEKDELRKNTGYNLRTNDHIGKLDFDKKFYKKYLNHENYNNLKGLKVKKIYEWKLGEALIFDRTFIHCASDLKKPKTGLTIFFYREKN
jgi:hypothetical protein